MPLDFLLANPDEICAMADVSCQIILLLPGSIKQIMQKGLYIALGGKKTTWLSPVDSYDLWDMSRDLYWAVGVPDAEASYMDY